MVDVNIFNEEHFDSIVRDIIKNIKTRIVRETEIRKIEIYLKKNISKASYSIPELTNGINNIKIIQKGLIQIVLCGLYE